MSASEVLSVSNSSFQAPNCSGKVFRCHNPEPIRYLTEDCQLGSIVFSTFDLILSIESFANGEESLCESVPVQGADF